MSNFQGTENLIHRIVATQQDFGIVSNLRNLVTSPAGALRLVDVINQKWPLL